MISYTHQFLFSLVFTIIVETVVLFFLVRNFLKKNSKEIKTSKIVFLGILSSLSTICYVWYVFPVLFYWSSNLALLLSEIFAVIVESLIYYFVLEIKYKKALIISFIANIASFSLGFLIKSVV